MLLNQLMVLLSLEDSESLSGAHLPPAEVHHAARASNTTHIIHEMDLFTLFHCILLLYYE